LSKCSKQPKQPPDGFWDYQLDGYSSLRPITKLIIINQGRRSQGHAPDKVPAKYDYNLLHLRSTKVVSHPAPSHSIPIPKSIFSVELGRQTVASCFVFRLVVIQISRLASKAEPVSRTRSIAT